MITKAHITRRASKEGIPAKTVERDYVLAHAVASIASHADQSMNLAFKGGTALRLTHYRRYRYSADLDFSVIGGTKAEALDLIRGAFEDVGSSSLSELHLTEDDPPRIAYVGPLGGKRTLKLDLADDEHVENTELRPLLHHWPDLPDAKVLVYSLLEVAGEKLRCIMQRLQCRDLFDLSVLFGDAGVDAVAAAELFDAKARHRGLDPATFADKYRERVPQYERRWEDELAEHVPGDIPHFKDTERRIARVLRRAGLGRSP